MPDTDSTDESDSADAEDDVVQIHLRLPADKYEWLQAELDSFTSDTGRIQYLIQFYSDCKEEATLLK